LARLDDLAGAMNVSRSQVVDHLILADNRRESTGTG
jgi:hypothetical protein